MQSVTLLLNIKTVCCMQYNKALEFNRKLAAYNSNEKIVENLKSSPHRILVRILKYYKTATITTTTTYTSTTIGTNTTTTIATFTVIGAVTDTAITAAIITIAVNC